MKHLDTIHQAVGTHMEKSMKMLDEASKAFESHVGKSSETNEAMQELATENFNFIMGSMQQAGEAAQSMLSAMSSGGFPAALEIQKSYMTYSRDALNEHVTRMGQAMGALTQEATSSFQGAFIKAAW